MLFRSSGLAPHSQFNSKFPTLHLHYPARPLPRQRPSLLSVRYPQSTRHLILLPTVNMGVAFDKCETRPANIDAILNGLDRYNPETTTVFQDYVVQQCEDRTFDCYANLALLKL